MISANLAAALAGDPMAIMALINQIQIHIREAVAADERVGVLLAEQERRIAAGEPLMTDEERAALKARIDANTARIEAGGGTI